MYINMRKWMLTFLDIWEENEERDPMDHHALSLIPLANILSFSLSFILFYFFID